jgi:hypothetical protein
MSLSVKMSGENVADLSVATGKNDTEMGSHACGLYGEMILHASFCESNRIFRSIQEQNSMQRRH